MSQKASDLRLASTAIFVQNTAMKHTLSCLRCSATFQSSYTHARYCSRRCRLDHGKSVNGYKSLGKTTGISSGTVGAIGELRVAVDLMIRGYDVFRALSPHTSCDLAFIENGQLLRVEVRSGYRTTTGNIRISNPKHRADILAICLLDEIIYQPDHFRN